MGKVQRLLRPANLVSKVPDDGAEADLSRFLGSQIRSLRKARDVTLGELSKKTGLSTGNLSQIERNLSSPTIKAVHSISRALGVNISWFFDDPHPAPPEERDYIVRAERRRKLDFGKGITDELLSPNLDGKLELLMSRFEPGADSGDEPYTHRGEEAGVVISGQLELWIGGRHFLLGEGDSFTFPSTVPHRYRNPGDAEAVVIWVMTPPSY